MCYLSFCILQIFVRKTMENTIKIVVPANIKKFCIPVIKTDVCAIICLIKKNLHHVTVTLCFWNKNQHILPFLNFGVSLILDGKVVTALFSQLPLLIRHPLRHSDGQYSVHSLPYRPKWHSKQTPLSLSQAEHFMGGQSSSHCKPYLPFLQDTHSPFLWHVLFAHCEEHVWLQKEPYLPFSHSKHVPLTLLHTFNLQ